MSIRANYDTPIMSPEYVKGQKTNAVAYVKESTVKMLVKFKVEPAAAVSAMKIKGVSIDNNGVLGDATEQTIQFVNGVSQYNGNPGGVEFSLNGTTPNKILASTEAWKWVVTQINGVNTASGIEMERTVGPRVYVLWDTPQTPWNQLLLNNQNPWTNALEFAISTTKASGKDDKDALAGFSDLNHVG